MTWDITSQLALTGGATALHLRQLPAGLLRLLRQPTPRAIPGQSQLLCAGLDRRTPPAPTLTTTISDNGWVPRINLTYKFTPDIMVYATYLEGLPAGRRQSREHRSGRRRSPMQADYLKNYEIGWKTQWFNHRLRWNGALFREDWNDFQFSFLVPPSITAIANGGNARILGVENELQWATTNNLTLSTNFTFLNPLSDAELLRNTSA